MSDTVGIAKREPSFYTILGLSFPPPKNDVISPNGLRVAYRRTLLLHHPDKQSVQSSREAVQNRPIPAEQFTVDQIVQAYETLSDPASREEYNERLRKSLTDTAVSQHINAKKFASSTSETHDLEDLEYADDKQLWFKSCRCGDSYQVNEMQLEEAAADGEIVVGCHGCSLNIKVIFQVVE